MEKQYILQVKGLVKSFPGVKALSGVKLDIEKGTVHAVMGENGAGKSTLMNILAGFFPPDRGEILFKGRRIKFRSPHEALRQGISMIHQELLPFPELTVAENMFMGRELVFSPTGWLKKRSMQREASRLLDRLGVRLSVTNKMKELSAAEMQAVEIAKALVHHAEVIIMDEPTSAISRSEVDALFQAIRDLKRQGVAVIYITHRMDEVFRIADIVTILRDGRYIETHEIGKLDPDHLIALMVGRELTPASPRAPNSLAKLALKVRGLTRIGRYAGVNFDLRCGEILGIAGLMGAGRTELANALFGLAPADQGDIEIRGRKVRIASPRDAIANGIALVSEDRREYGLVGQMSVKHNLTLSSLRNYCRALWIDWLEENRVADDCISSFAVRTPSRNQKAAYLSGGNQQKIVIAKALLSKPDILILDEPTRGIDIATRSEIHRIITDLAQAGKAVVMISSELPEILALSTRILVMQGGRITAELDPRYTSQEEIMKKAMTGREGGRHDGMD